MSPACFCLGLVQEQHLCHVKASRAKFCVVRRGREGATQRLLDVASLAEEEWPNRMTRLRDWIIWRLVYAGNGALAQPLSACQPACASGIMPLSSLLWSKSRYAGLQDCWNAAYPTAF